MALPAAEAFADAPPAQSHGLSRSRADAFSPSLVCAAEPAGALAAAAAVDISSAASSSAVACGDIAVAVAVEAVVGADPCVSVGPGAPEPSLVRLWLVHGYKRWAWVFPRCATFGALRARIAGQKLSVAGLTFGSRVLRAEDTPMALGWLSDCAPGAAAVGIRLSRRLGRLPPDSALGADAAPPPFPALIVSEHRADSECGALCPFAERRSDAQLAALRAAHPAAIHRAACLCPHVQQLSERNAGWRQYQITVEKPIPPEAGPQWLPGSLRTSAQVDSYNAYLRLHSHEHCLPAWHGRLCVHSRALEFALAGPWADDAFPDSIKCRQCGELRDKSSFHREQFAFPCNQMTCMRCIKALRVPRDTNTSKPGVRALMRTARARARTRADARADADADA